MPSDYTLSELANLSGVSPRTVRYYIQSGLLPAPVGAGPAARYTDAHLDKLRLIRKMQSAHLPLAEIRRRMEAIPDERIAAVADAIADEPPANSALDYISSVLNPPRAPLAAPVMARPAMPSAVADSLPWPSGPLPEPAAASASAATPEPLKSTPSPRVEAPRGTPREPDRAQWERISLDPDVEIHIRRPLSRAQNKRVERLISIARQLLEED